MPAIAGRRLAGEHQPAEQHRRDDRHRVGLEQVGGHAGAIADVVADVVGDHRGIARIVFGNARLRPCPTRSAPTSAPLVNMPPPRRAKIEISEPPNAKPTSGCSDSRTGSCTSVGRQHPVEASHAEQAEADDEQAGDRAAAESDVQRCVRCRCVAASAVRTLARTETFMPT